MLHIYLLGRYRATLDQHAVVGFRSLRTQAILAYLAMRGDCVSRTELVHLLWPDYSRNAGLASLRSALTNLRHLTPENLIISRYDVRLTNYWCDALVVGTRTTNLTFLPGFEGIDSPDFQRWVYQLSSRASSLPTIRTNTPQDLDSVQNALVMLGSLGCETTALDALGRLSQWLRQAHYAKEAREVERTAEALAGHYYASN